MKIHFAWCGSSDAYDVTRHQREDEKIFHLEISHKEAAFARAQVTIQNPGYGLLWPRDKQHCLISFDTKLIFRGRLLCVPSEVRGELCTLEFVAMPDDVEEQRQRLCEEIKTNGVYDPLFLPIQPELRDLLQAYTALPYWDRTHGGLSLSDLMRGCSHMDLGSRMFRDSLSLRMIQEPLSKVDLSLFRLNGFSKPRVVLS